MKSIRLLILVAFLAFLMGGGVERYSPQGESSFDSLLTLILLAAIGFNLSRRSKDKAVARKEPTTRLEPPPMIGGMRVIYHIPPWAVIERGEALGKLGNAIISSWIRTSDKRVADYVGIQQFSYPDHCFCIEIPEKSELIVSPGMVYTIRPS